LSGWTGGGAGGAKAGEGSPEGVDFM
jgi:hypothetical protein